MLENSLLYNEDAAWEKWNRDGLAAGAEEDRLARECVNYNRECNGCGQCSPKVEE